MKAELASWHGKVFGINLTTENKKEDRALEHLFKSGANINSLTPGRDNQSSLQIVFADLVKRVGAHG